MKNNFLTEFAYAGSKAIIYKLLIDKKIINPDYTPAGKPIRIHILPKNGYEISFYSESVLPNNFLESSGHNIEPFLYSDEYNSEQTYKVDVFPTTEGFLPKENPSVRHLAQIPEGYVSEESGFVTFRRFTSGPLQKLSFIPKKMIFRTQLWRFNSDKTIRDQVYDSLFDEDLPQPISIYEYSRPVYSRVFTNEDCFNGLRYPLTDKSWPSVIYTIPDRNITNGVIETPIYVLINGLDPNTEYTVWATVGDEQYNSTTVTTGAIINSNIEFNLSYTSSQDINEKITSLNTILNIFLRNILRIDNVNKNYNLKSNVDAYYILGNLSEEFNEEQGVHQALKKYILKDFMKQWDNLHENKELINLFMEFATNIPKASWKWIEDDCYPITTNTSADWSHIALMIAAISISNLADDYE